MFQVKSKQKPNNTTSDMDTPPAKQIKQELPAVQPFKRLDLVKVLKRGYRVIYSIVSDIQLC